MNAPEVFEQFREQENKVLYQKVEKIENTCLFTINDEDHTFGNAVKMMLLRNPNVRFVAYRKPHPLENKIEIKIQTNKETTPYKAFKEALKNLNEDIDECVKQFDEYFQGSRSMYN